MFQGLLRKVVKKNTMGHEPPEEVARLPGVPPSPALSHLNRDEMEKLTEVFRRQEEMEKLEQENIRKLKSELEAFENKVKDLAANKNASKALDMRLCKLCYKTKFADGIGRICQHCQKRVCSKCRQYLKPTWNTKKHKFTKGRWVCNLCSIKWEVMCKTGLWYHGPETSGTQPAVAFFGKLQRGWTAPLNDGDSQLDSDSSAHHRNVKVESVATDSEMHNLNLHSKDKYRRSSTPLEGETRGRRRRLQRQSSRLAAVTPCTDSHSDSDAGQRQSSRMRCRRRVLPGVNGRFNSDMARKRVPASDNSDSESGRTLERVRPIRGKGISHENGECTINILENVRKKLEANEKPSSDSETGRVKSRVLPGKRVSLVTTSELIDDDWDKSSHNSEASDKHNIDAIDVRQRRRLLGVTSDEEEFSTVEPWSRDSNGLTSKHMIDAGHNGAQRQARLLTVDSNATSPDGVDIDVFSKVSTFHFGVRSSGRSSGQRKHTSTEIASPSKEHNGTMSQPRTMAKVAPFSRKAPNIGKDGDKGRRQLPTLNIIPNIDVSLIGEVLQVTIQKSSEEVMCSTFGYGLRVVGGKIDENGMLCAYITRIVPGSPADEGGTVSVGDAVLEWNHQSLINLTFEATQQIIQSSYGQECVNLLIRRIQKRSSSLNPRKTQQDDAQNSEGQSADEHSGNRRGQKYFHYDTGSAEKTKKHRLLPPTPIHSSRADTATTGRLELQVWYDETTTSVKVTVRQASGLKRETNKNGQLDLPNPYVKVSLLPGRWQYPLYRTETITVNAAPVWNKTFTYYNMMVDELQTRSLECTIWDYHPKENNTFMGEVLLDLNAVNLDGVAQWYYLAPHDENNGQLMQPTPKKGERKEESEPPEEHQISTPPMPAHERAKALLKIHNRGSGTIKRFLQRHLIRNSSPSSPSSLYGSVQGRDLHMSDSELSDHTQNPSLDDLALRGRKKDVFSPCCAWFPLLKFPRSISNDL